MELLHRIRGFIMPTLVGGTLIFAILSLWVGPQFTFGFVPFGALLLLGLYDRAQTVHSITRNYPVLGHLRFLLEGAGPELHQYFVESNTSGRPFDFFEDGQLLKGEAGPILQREWDTASESSFARV